MEIIKEVEQNIDRKFSEIHEAYKKHDALIAELKAQQVSAKDNANAVEAVKDANEKIIACEKNIKELKGELTALAQRNASSPATKEVKSIGALVIEKGFAYKGGLHNFGVFDNPFQSKAIATTAAASTGNTVRPMRDPNLYFSDMPLTIMDIIGVVNTDAPSVEIVRRDSLARVAAIQTSEGVTAAPQGTFTTTLVTVPMRTIMAEYTASRQALGDNSQLENILNYELTYDGSLRREVQVLLGDGTGVNMNGINTQAASYVAATPVETTNLDRLLLAATQVKTTAFMESNAFVLNPSDWVKLVRTSKDTTGQYLFANPFEMTQKRLWGRPVVECFSLTAGNFLTGAFDRACKYYERNSVEITVNEQHGTNATQGLVTFVMYMRGGIAVTMPTGFVKGALL